MKKWWLLWIKGEVCTSSVTKRNLGRFDHKFLTGQAVPQANDFLSKRFKSGLTAVLTI